jgi:hypothetical protein
MADQCLADRDGPIGKSIFQTKKGKSPIRKFLVPATRLRDHRCIT